MSDPQAGECRPQSIWRSGRGRLLVGEISVPSDHSAPNEPMPDELWDAVLADPRAADPAMSPLGITLHVLRVECVRCLRIVEIQKADAVRFYGCQAVWKDVGQRLLDQMCTNRTGRHEEDGCWSDWRK